MSASTPDHHSLAGSPRSIARAIGVLTLLTVIGGIYAQGVVSERLVVWRDAAATANNLVAHRNLYLSGVAVYFAEMACSISSTVLFYVLLKPVGRSLSLVAVALGLVANILKTMGRVFFAAPLYLVGATRFHSMSPETLNDLSLVLLHVNDHSAGIAMAFFGFNGVLTGILMLKSTFLPRVLGVLSLLGGIGWLAHLWPPFGYQMEGFVLPFALVGVAVTTFWFLVKGVDEPRWHEQARANRL